MRVKVVSEPFVLSACVKTTEAGGRNRKSKETSEGTIQVKENQSREKKVEMSTRGGEGWWIRERAVMGGWWLGPWWPGPVEEDTGSSLAHSSTTSPCSHWGREEEEEEEEGKSEEQGGEEEARVWRDQEGKFGHRKDERRKQREMWWVRRREEKTGSRGRLVDFMEGPPAGWEVRKVHRGRLRRPENVPLTHTHIMLVRAQQSTDLDENRLQRDTLWATQGWHRLSCLKWSQYELVFHSDKKKK